MSPRSPSSSRRAPRLTRFGAAAIDAALGLLLALLLSSSLGGYFARRAVVTLRIGEPDTLWQGPVPMVLGMFGEVVYLLPFTLLAVFAIEPILGATIGKALVGLRVADREGGPAEGGRLWLRWAVKASGLCGWTLSLLAGSGRLAALASLAVAAVGLGTLLALGPERSALHDRLSETRVIARKSGVPAPEPR